MPARVDWMQRARGFTLIEVLVTMFVLAIGLLAVASLQAMSKKLHYDAIQRTSAGALAQSMVESMRGNPAHLDAYLTTDASQLSLNTDCAQTICSEAQLASYDLYRWNREMQGVETQSGSDSAGGLVNPTGCISKDGALPGLYIIAIAWRGITGLDPPDADDPSDDPTRNTCGQGIGRYDDPLASGNDDRMRRIVLINAYISDPNAATLSNAP